MVEPMTMKEVEQFAERLANLDSNKMEFIGPRRWDAYRYIVPAVIVALGLLKAEVDPDVLIIRKVLHAQQRAGAPPDGGWSNMSYIKGSYDDLPVFQAALKVYKESKDVSKN